MIDDPMVFASLARLHGLAGALGLALLLHPVLNLRGKRRHSWWTRFTVYLAATGIGLEFAAGWLLYPTYRAEVKPHLVKADPATMWLFETKEHLAAMTAALAIGGALTLLAAGRSDAGRRTAWVLLTCAFALDPFERSTG